MIFRYLRLWWALARFSLARELAFRGNFLVKIFVEILWLGILLFFYQTVFGMTTEVAGWKHGEYLFFVGCNFALNGLIETLFLENCQQYADLIRTGDLDFYLLKPIDEQFLVSCRTVDWSCLINVIMGIAVMLFALVDLGRPIDVLQACLFLVLMGCGTLLAYSFLVMMMSVAVWLMRNQSLMEMWWLFSTLMRYPREIFFQQGSHVAALVGRFFSFAVPIMLVTNVPSSVMVRVVEPTMVAYTFFATFAVVYVSRRVFRYSLSRYRQRE